MYDKDISNHIYAKMNKGDIMGIFSLILVVLWLSLLFDGIYGIVKGYFYREQSKAEKHAPDAYSKWVRITSVFIILCAVLNTIWCILDSLSKKEDNTYIVLIIITVMVMIAIAAVSYCLIVKPADKKLGIESEFSRILKENKEDK